MRLAERVERISVSPTMAVMAEAEKCKARGIDIVDFGPGEPDFPTPDHVKRAAVRALEENRTKYTPTAGILPLRGAVCEWHASQFGSSYAPPECMMSVGAKHVVYNAASALINPGDEVVIPRPYWVSYPDIVKSADGEPIFVETRASDGFRLRAADIERAVTPRSRLVILNSPNNPTGAVIPPEEFARILDVCRRRDLWLLSDECYSHFVYDGGKPFSVGSLPGAKDCVIVAGSLSKTFAMTGWRIGYALAPASLIAAMVKLQSQSTSNPTSIAQYAALEALRGPMDSVAVMLAEYSRRRARIVAGLRQMPGICCSPPQGAFYVFPGLAESLGNSSFAASAQTVAQNLLERAHVAVVPGEAFGGPGHLRLSFATSMERIEEGLRRLAEFFSSDKMAESGSASSTAS